MTIRRSLERIRSRQFYLAGAGFLIFLVGSLAGAADESYLVLGLAGFFAFAAGILVVLFGLRCPRCGGILGYAFSWPPGTLLRISPRIRFCQYCGVDLDAELGAGDAGRAP